MSINSGDRIRKRFLLRIGIDQTQCGAKDDTGSTNLIQGSCLGEVRPFLEPLKVVENVSVPHKYTKSEDGVFFLSDDTEIESPLVSDVSSDTSSFSLEFSSLDSIELIPSPIGSSLSCSTHTSDSFQSSCYHSLKRNRLKRKVILDSEVTVMPIPMRSEYSDRVKKRIWTSASELYQNAVRNTVEFASEGWNWRNVIEDECMLHNSASGELIHPVHLEKLLIQLGIPSEVDFGYPSNK